jgi:hypothetical protein
MFDKARHLLGWKYVARLTSDLLECFLDQYKTGFHGDA